MATRQRKDQRIAIRATAQERDLLEAASRQESMSISGFVLAKATSAASEVLAERRAFALSEDEWAAFAAALDRPARELPKLTTLLTVPTALDAG